MSKNWLRHIIYSPIQDWTEADLSNLTSHELQSVCKLLGIPFSGGKEKQLENILSSRELRIELARWVHSELQASNHDACVQVASTIEENYKGKQLKAMCRKAKCFAPSTKYGMAASLIGWVLACRSRGQQFYKEQLAIALARQKGKPKQLQLFPLHQPDFKSVAQRAADVTVPQRKTIYQQQPVRDDSL